MDRAEPSRAAILWGRDSAFRSDLGAELVAARTKFPGPANPNLAALTEEVGELAQAILQQKPAADIIAEAVQVATMAQRVATEGDSTLGWNP